VSLRHTSCALWGWWCSTKASSSTDPGRGISVELLLTLLLASRSRGIAPQLIVLSAVIGAIKSFDE
jgi:helicase